MALIIVPELADNPIKIFSDNDKIGSILKFQITGLTGAADGPVTWTLKTQDGGTDAQSQAAPPMALTADSDGYFYVPTVANMDGPLTLTFTEQGDMSNTGDFTALEAKVFTTLQVTASTIVSTGGQPVTFFADIEDASGWVDGVLLEWDGPGKVVPANAKTNITSKADLSTFQMTTNAVTAADLTSNHVLYITLTVGKSGPVIKTPVLFPDPALLPPSPGFPLRNNTIDDTVIAAITASPSSLGLPFSVPKIANFEVGGYLILSSGQQPMMGFDFPESKNSDRPLWPQLINAITTTGAFDFTGPMALSYRVYDARGQPTGLSMPLNLQISRKQFPSPMFVDDTLPRPLVEPGTYNKRNLSTDDLVVRIPVRLNATAPVFNVGDLLQVDVTLTGYTEDNENQVKTLPSVTVIVTSDHLNVDFIYVTFQRTLFKQIESSFGAVNYTRTPKQSSQTTKSPTKTIAVDTVDAFSSSNAYHIDRISALARHL